MSNPDESEKNDKQLDLDKSVDKKSLRQTGLKYDYEKEEDDVFYYVETSDVIMEYYKKQKTFSLEKYFIRIDDWLSKKTEQSQNYPLLIESHSGVGKKTLLVQWIEYHNKTSYKHYKDIVISHFASAGGNNSNYFFTIYRILVKLRELFNIKQKVELLEEKIRKNFYYWLDLCSRKIKKNVTFDGDIIIVIEGIEHFKDIETGRESNLKFWLPKVLPDRVKFIITAEANSNSHNYLRNIGSDVICLTPDKQDVYMFDNMFATLASKKYFVPQEHVDRVLHCVKTEFTEDLRGNALFVKTVVATMCPYETAGIVEETETLKRRFKDIYENFNYQELCKIRTLDDLMQFI